MCTYLLYTYKCMCKHLYIHINIHTVHKHIILESMNQIINRLINILEFLDSMWLIDWTALENKYWTPGRASHCKKHTDLLLL